MADRIAENGAIQYALANPESNSKREGLSGYIMGALQDWLKNPVPPLNRLAAPGRLRGKFFDSGIAPLSMDFANQQFYSNQNGVMQAKSFNDVVTFSRASNATVTNSSGLITYAPSNLLTYSEQFDNSAWSKARCTVSANTVSAPNGTTTADTLVEDTTSNSHPVYRTVASFVSGQSYTFSVYVKANVRTQAYINIANTAFASAPFVSVNLSTGAKIADGNGGTGTVTDAGNGWYRVSLTATAGASGNGDVYVQPMLSGTPNYLGTGANAINIWGSQWEIGSTASTYNSTTVKNLLGYSELFDNAAWTKSNSFVQTNLLTYSEEFDNTAGWTKNFSTITANATLAPNGYQTADALYETAVSGTHNIYAANITKSATSQPYNASIYIKPNGRNRIYFQLQSNTSNGVFCMVEATGSGTIVTAASTFGTGWTAGIATIILDNNGFYRVSLSGTSDTKTTIFSQVFLVESGTTTSYLGDITKGIYIWGAQLVQGSVAGDYRRTDAAALPIYYANHNGVVCAEKLVENTATSTGHNILPAAVTTIIGTSYTASAYVKAGERTWCILYDVASAKGRYFNLANGTIGSAFIGAPSSESITSLGNGWYRISITATATGTAGGARIYLATGDGISSYTGDGTSGIYIFGAQLSDSASLDPYVCNAGAAPSAAAYYGPRFDYDPVTLQPKGLLIEEQRTNLLLNSSILGTALGTQLVTVTAVEHTLSFYGTGTVAITGTYTGSLVGSGAYPTRSTLTFTPTAGVITLTVTGTVQFAQLEAGAFATSYIPTAASQVTRSADVATIQGSNFYSWYNQNEGSFMVNAAESSTALSGNRKTLFSTTTGNFNNVMRVGIESGTSAAYQVITEAVSQASITITSAFTANTYSKVGAVYKTNDYVAVVNGGTVSTDTSGTVPIQSIMDIGYGPQVSSGTANTAGDYTNGWIKQISYYNKRLDNTTLQGITT